MRRCGLASVQVYYNVLKYTMLQCPAAPIYDGEAVRVLHLVVLEVYLFDDGAHTKK